MRKGSRRSNGNVEEVVSRPSTIPDHLRRRIGVMETGSRLWDQDAFTTAGGEIYHTADNVSAFGVLARVAQIEIFLKCPPLDA
jgi:hypothetical protein